jgi:hypothetical protein
LLVFPFLVSLLALRCQKQKKALFLWLFLDNLSKKETKKR